MNKLRQTPSIFHCQGEIVPECISVQVFTYGQQAWEVKVQLRSSAVGEVADVSVSNLISTENIVITKQRSGVYIKLIRNFHFLDLAQDG